MVFTSPRRATPHATTGSAHQKRSPDSISRFIADDGEQIAGFALATAPGSGQATDPEDAAIIGLLATHPRCQAQGLGRTLLRAITSELVDAGHARAVLHSLLDNRSAVALYESEGWTPMGPECEHSLLERRTRAFVRDLTKL
ncbi:GNAT family N-acetyltransferase [Brachybacterium subflavum]|uniref:GNAT family N-acetyltransferase n=1 Tax=Brachybacterium subflavum TaxID=2585206 RepID=UPI0018795CA6|nr:GNAT family N-acetyltransferase [Brachybacterium subflavum]